MTRKHADAEPIPAATFRTGAPGFGPVGRAELVPAPAIPAGFEPPVAAFTSRRALCGCIATSHMFRSCGTAY